MEHTHGAHCRRRSTPILTKTPQNYSKHSAYATTIFSQLVYISKFYVHCSRNNNNVLCYSLWTCSFRWAKINFVTRLCLAQTNTGSCNDLMDQTTQEQPPIIAYTLHLFLFSNSLLYMASKILCFDLIRVNGSFIRECYTQFKKSPTQTLQIAYFIPKYTQIFIQ